MARYCRMPKTQKQRLGGIERMGLGLLPMPLVGLSVNPAMMNWAAAPARTHSSWNSTFPGALIASGHILEKRAADGKVAIVKGGVAQTPYQTVDQLKQAAQSFVKNSSGQIIFACCNLGDPASSSQPTATSTSTSTTDTNASNQSSSNDWSSILTGVGAILGAGLNPAVSIYAQHQQAKAEREALRRGGVAPQQVIVPAATGMSPALIVVLVLAVMMMLGGMMYMMNKASAPKTRKKRSKRGRR